MLLPRVLVHWRGDPGADSGDLEFDFLRAGGALAWENLHLSPYLHLPFAKSKHGGREEGDLGLPGFRPRGVG